MVIYKLKQTLELGMNIRVSFCLKIILKDGRLIQHFLLKKIKHDIVLVQIYR